MTTDIDNIKTWYDAIDAAGGDMRKASELWALVKEKGGKVVKRGGSGSDSERDKDAEDYEDEWIGEEKELNDLLKKAGVKERPRREYIIDLFFNVEDMSYLDDPYHMDSVLRTAKISADKRRMILRAWYHLDEMAVNEVLTGMVENPYAGEKKSYGRSIRRSDVFSDEDEVESSPLNEVEKTMDREFELLRKKLERERALLEMKEMQKELRALHGETDEGPKKVKIVLRDPNGNIIKDADTGLPVYVYITPEEYYEQMNMLQAQKQQTEQPQGNLQMEMMYQMLQQQQQTMMQMMQAMMENRNNSRDSEEIAMMKEMFEKQMEMAVRDKEEMKMNLTKLQNEIEKRKREELEAQVQELQQNLYGIFNELKKNKGGINGLEDIKKLKMEYPELFGGVSLEQIRLEMDKMAMQNSFELMKQNQELLASSLEDGKELLKQKIELDMQLQARERLAQLGMSPNETLLNAGYNRGANMTPSAPSIDVPPSIDTKEIIDRYSNKYDLSPVGSVSSQAADAIGQSANGLSGDRLKRFEKELENVELSN